MTVFWCWRKTWHCWWFYVVEVLFFDGDGVDVVDVVVFVDCILVFWTAIDVFFSWVVEVVNFSIH